MAKETFNSETAPEDFRIGRRFCEDPEFATLPANRQMGVALVLLMEAIRKTPPNNRYGRLSAFMLTMGKLVHMLELEGK